MFVTGRSEGNKYVDFVMLLKRICCVTFLKSILSRIMFVLIQVGIHVSIGILNSEIITTYITVRHPTPLFRKKFI